MALEAKRAAFNAAVKAAMTAWDDLCDGLSAPTQLKLVPILKDFRGSAGATLGATDGTSAAFNANLALQRTVMLKMIAAASDTNNVYFIPGIEFGGWPLFYMVSNDAGEFE